MCMAVWGLMRAGVCYDHECRVGFKRKGVSDAGVGESSVLGIQVTEVTD